MDQAAVEYSMTSYFHVPEMMPISYPNKIPPNAANTAAHFNEDDMVLHPAHAPWWCAPPSAGKVDGSELDSWMRKEG